MEEAPHIPAFHDWNHGGRSGVMVGGQELDRDLVGRQVAKLAHVFGAAPHSAYILIVWDWSLQAASALFAALFAKVPVCVVSPDRVEAFRGFLKTFPPTIAVAHQGVSKLSGASKRILKSTRVVDHLGEVDPAPLIESTAIVPGTLYLANTSGTTGFPKVLAIPGSTFNAFSQWGCNVLDLSSTAIWGEIGSPSFDLPMTNVLLALASGAKIHFIGATSERMQLGRLIPDHGITHLRMTTSLLPLLTRGRAPKIKVLGIGGEAIFPSALTPFTDVGSFVATYGCTECGGFLLATTGSKVDLFPDPNQLVASFASRTPHVDVRSEEIDQQSELVVAGLCLPSGYLYGQNDLESAHFYQNVAGSLEFRTGDLARETNDRVIVAGRRGIMLKRRGEWVNLHDVSEKISNALGRRTAAAVIDGRLIAFLECPTATRPAMTRIESSRLDACRNAEIPDIFVSVPYIPVAPSGKLDHAEVSRLSREMKDIHDSQNALGAGSIT